MGIQVAAKDVVHQLSTLLEKLTPQVYAQSLEVLNGSSIGQHVRHTLEFFTCLFEGEETGIVDYDARKRDIFLESNNLEAINCLRKIEKSLDLVTDNIPLVLHQKYYGEEVSKVDTNLYRELIYNIEHAVHHMALIRIGLRDMMPDLELGSDFGVANSTVKYRKELVSH